MVFNKYLKGIVVFSLALSVFVANSNHIKAKKEAVTSYTYYSNNKVKTKKIVTKDGAKLYNVNLYSYNAKGKLNNQTVTKYGNNNKVNRKQVYTYKNSKLYYTHLYTYKTNGQATKLTTTKYGKNNKRLLAVVYKYNKNKKVKYRAYYYYNTHTKSKTPLKKVYATVAYNKKGKVYRIKYHTNKGKRLAVSKEAKALVGKKYRSGGTNPKTGFDCSGFTSYVYKKTTNMNIGRASYNQTKKGKYVKVSTKKLQPGDVLFWGSKSSPYHVGIYVGNGRYVHASTPSTGVQSKKLSSFTPSYAKRMIY
ncbi:C40 family peptidase [Erysipelotrichaceae bacterium OttesenSCG-928-M19]|nr:C40 family peptidase [Erysipelotrichaceae bacterium OttesenSCG-928-M19]